MYCCLCDIVFAQDSSNLPQWEKNLKEQHTKLRDDFLQQLETMKQKDIDFYNNFVRNCTPATLTTIGTAKVVDLKNGYCLFSKTFGKNSIECQFPKNQLGSFADESIKELDTGVETQKFSDIVNKYCVLK